ncbi:hypothetical protein HETIRDRAFT_316098 [Heterobasidion irregulare TC 32-1]|uniref:CCHC-type domain-containing protein n=1 Tax=Heterobasidion irregulare (strain TC 32-1) TaxID=747525 RepID=W4KDH8_HETIT|nr:uncharacterized protein HETIRDRAFT_316098 [Heterobasidion irregulare TC 32-1]ETW83370.1 hypothetical protein HETIRDRAFT_316098 [Heterobasidion irregulare TC 32-1]
MSTNPRNPESKGPAMAKPTPFDGNRKRTEQFLHKIDLMILARKYDFPDEFTKIAYTLSYMKGGSAGIWSRNFTKARNTNNDWDLYAWKPITGMTSVRQKISTDFEEFDKTADARDKLARINQGKESFNTYLQLFEQIAELAGVDLETKKTHFLRGLKWELARGIYQDPAAQTTWDELVAKAKRHETMRIEEMRARDLRQGKYQVFTPTNYYSNFAPTPRQERESQYVPMDVDAAELEVEAIRFKKLTPEERNRLTKEGKCFYCKKPGHMARGCPSRPKRRFYPPSRGRFIPRSRTMRAMEAGEEEDEEYPEESRPGVAHVKQMMMGLNPDEIAEVRAYSESKDF